MLKLLDRLFGSVHYRPILYFAGITGAWIQMLGAAFFLVLSLSGGPLGSLEAAEGFLEASVLTGVITLAFRGTFGSVTSEKNSVS